MITALLLTALGCDAPAPVGPPNLILISVDGLRADHVGAYGRTPSPTPTLDALAADGLVFENAFSQSNESLFSHAALFTGRYVSEIASPDYQTFVVPPGAMLVSEVLGLYGYHTAAFMAGGHTRGAYGFDQGFSLYEDSADFGAFYHKVPQALEWVFGAARAPFFLILHGYDCHRPYNHAGLYYHAFGGDYGGGVDRLLTDRTATERIHADAYYPGFELVRFTNEAGDPVLDPGGYPRLKRWAESHDGEPLSQEDLDHILDHYDTGAFAADLQVGRFLKALEDEGLMENSLVIVTSDHGEDLNDHGFYNHRVTLKDSTTRVPLILAGGALPEALRGQRIAALAEAVDVAPTLLAAAGATPPAGLAGRDLLGDDPAPEVIFQEGVLPMISARTATHRLIFRGIPLNFPYFDLALRAASIPGDHFALYDLRADPGEQTDVSADQPEVAEQLRAAMLQWRAEMEASDFVGSQPQDTKLQEILRERGYWQ